MERRLLIARDLLKPTGILFAAIGNDEHHRFRMLLDQVFGDRSFISDIVWQGGTDNYAKYISNKADYMLVYARDKDALDHAETSWREPNPLVEAGLVAGERIWEESAHNPSVAAKAMKSWWEGGALANAAEVPTKTIKRYVNFDEDGRIYYGGADAGAPERRSSRCFRQLPHPESGRLCPAPKNGWRWDEDELMQRLKDGRILFGSDHTTVPQRKSYLVDLNQTIARSVFFERDRRAASLRLANILGDKRFPNPKDHQVLMRWFRMTAPQDAVILDFFGGSGTTTEAVMQLNAEDGGTRQSILVTNNEVGAVEAKKLRKSGLHPGDVQWEASGGVFEHICRPPDLDRGHR